MTNRRAIGQRIADLNNRIFMFAAPSCVAMCGTPALTKNRQPAQTSTPSMPNSTTNKLAIPFSMLHIDRAVFDFANR
jgi:hypothetical protein